MVTIYDLPDEVLEVLFSKLPLRDRKHVRLVNKQWLEVCNSASITKHEIIKVTKKKLNQFTTPRGNLNLAIYGTENPCGIVQFWEKHGISVKTLKLLGKQLQLSELCDIIRFCPNMENLTVCYDEHEVARSNSLPFDDLCMLRLNVDLIEVDDLWGLTKGWSKLKRLDFIHCDVIGGKETVIKVLMLLIVNVTELVFNKCLFITKESLKTILDKIGHQLTGLYLSGFEGFFLDQSLPTIANKLINLENLKLNYFTENLDFLSDFLMPLRNLKFISLIGTDLTNNLLFVVAGLEHLKGLDISTTIYSPPLTSDGLVKAFGQRHRNLIDIRLTNLQYVTDDVLAAILPQLPNLECLDLGGCSDISEQGVSAIVTNCKRLKCLSLERCDKIQTLMKPARVSSLKSLMYLNLFGCAGIPVWEIVEKLKLDLLKTFELNCYYLSEESLLALLGNFPSLQRVHFPYSYQVDDRVFKMYEAFSQTCKFSRGYMSLNIVSIFDFSALYV